MQNDALVLIQGDDLETSDLKKLGLKATVPRMKILEMLEQSDAGHFSADEIYKHLVDSGEEVGLATVYRVLTQFESAGIVVKHHFEGGQSVYELNHGSHHDHMLCVKCGHVEEFFDETIEERQRKIAEKAGFDMTDHTLYIYGICKSCQKKRK